MKVAVIGAGFAGLVIANNLLEAGAEVTIYEEHRRVGYPPHCTGIVSQRTVRLIGEPAERSIVDSYSKIYLESSRGLLALPLREPVYKLNRVRLEELMLERALSMGAKLIVSRATRISPRGAVEAGGSRAIYDSVVLAEGLYGALRRDLGIGFAGKALYGLNVDYRNESGFRGILVSFGRGSEGFFSWLVGHRDAMTVGAGTRSPARLRYLISSIESRYGLAGKLGSYGGRIVTGPPGERLSVGSVHVVGDAAGLNKPLTGGGLYPNALVAYVARRMIKSGAEINRAIYMAVRVVADKMRRQAALSGPVLAASSVIPALLSLYGALRGRELPALDFDDHEKIPVEGVMGIIKHQKRRLL